MIGDANLFFNDLDDPRACEIEIMIAEPAFRGKGHGTEATQLLMNYGVAKLNVQRYTAKISAKNEASIGLFTKKLGFRQTGFSEVFQEVALERPVDSSDLTPVGQALIRPLTLLYDPVEM
ncbi:hypothetical protein IWQ60_003921 [Tieghemiomyces parasiticus]|uniref:N-acetyltransferase domain-containing protein n=1 Tax=Tieghemiomyces parasiticus TaxID=78921 RepID=A0A9W8A8R8_9FUNG|nr:hypothetical protein IWQ60_003921 [Tieghemiomyces parasiticus]